jgi:hypothetical protein
VKILICRAKKTHGALFLSGEVYTRTEYRDKGMNSVTGMLDKTAR